jgi:hypothetical protein
MGFILMADTLVHTDQEGTIAAKGPSYAPFNGASTKAKKIQGFLKSISDRGPRCYGENDSRENRPRKAQIASKSTGARADRLQRYPNTDEVVSKGRSHPQRQAAVHRHRSMPGMMLW